MAVVPTGTVTRSPSPLSHPWIDLFRSVADLESTWLTTLAARTRKFRTKIPSSLPPRLGRQHEIVGSRPAQNRHTSSRRKRLEPPMQSDPNDISEQCRAQKRKWAESDRTGFHVFETALAKGAIDLTRIVPFRLKP